MELHKILVFSVFRKYITKSKHQLIPISTKSIPMHSTLGNINLKKYNRYLKF